MIEKKLLLVDDEDGIRRFLGLSLEELGYQVETAANGQEALERFIEFAPPIVLTDIKMPVMDGIELLRRIKTRNPEAEVIIITGHGDLDLAIEALKNDAADFITKPINDDVLEISLSRTWEKIEMKRQLRDYTENLERLVMEKTRRIVELERQTAVCGVVEGLSTTLADAASEVESQAGLFNELPCLVSVHNRDLEIVAANQLFKERVGDFTGRPGAEVYADPEGEGPGPLRRTFESGKGQRSKQTLRSADGEDLPVTVFTAPVPNNEGQVDFVLNIAVDMSELSRLREELLDTQLKFQRLFDEAPCYISVQNADYTIAEVNRRFAEDFPDAVGRKCYEVYRRRQEPCVDCTVLQSLQDGCSHQMETVVTTESGEQINVLVWSAPLRNAAGEVNQVMEMSTDITEIRRLQEHLTSLGVMIGSMSHGVKGMLTALDGGLYRLESGIKKQDHERVARAAETLKSMIERIKRMVMDILYYAKSRELEGEELDAAGFLRDVTALVREKAEAAGVDYRCDIPDDLGSLEADPDALSAALVNFLENAVDACETTSGARVAVAAADRDGRLEIAIEDNGAGMDQETKDKIFTLFFSSKGKKGSGIGLFISNQTVERHGGSIAVESEPGKGARFTIALPRRLPRTEKTPVREQEI
jgi:PAS domain S-box-containing protein